MLPHTKLESLTRRYRDLDDLIAGKPGPLRVLADLLGARRLIDADGPELPLILRQNVGADPADVL